MMMVWRDENKDTVKHGGGTIMLRDCLEREVYSIQHMFMYINTNTHTLVYYELQFYFLKVSFLLMFCGQTKGDEPPASVSSVRVYLSGTGRSAQSDLSSGMWYQINSWNKNRVCSHRSDRLFSCTDVTHSEPACFPERRLNNRHPTASDTCGWETDIKIR